MCSDRNLARSTDRHLPSNPEEDGVGPAGDDGNYVGVSHDHMPLVSGKKTHTEEDTKCWRCFKGKLKEWSKGHAKGRSIARSPL